MKLLFDIMNSSQVNTLYPIIKQLSNTHEINIIARNFAETLGLLENLGLECLPYGGYAGQSRIKKRITAISMIASLLKLHLDFDYSISMGSYTSPVITFIKRKESIVITDNEYSYVIKGLLSNIIDWYVLPIYLRTALPNPKNEKYIYFHGFKEDIPIADYSPDPLFRKSIPFDDYLLIRPEALKANYLPIGLKSIIPQLLAQFKDDNIIFLPRYPEDNYYTQGFSNIYIPPRPINGLDACYHARAVMTGSGTLAREAALLGIPAISFYPGSTLLSVDKELINRGWIFHSLDVKNIAKMIANQEKRLPDISRSVKVKRELLCIIEGILK